MSKVDADKGLKRDLGFWSALAIIVGTIIGAGVFMKPAVVLQYVGGSEPLGLLAWVIGGIMVLTGGLTVAELGAMIPRTGGVYAFLEEIYGETVSYMFGWMRSVVFAPATLAALALYFAVAFVQTFSVSPDMKIPIAFISLLILMLINIAGAKYSGYFQTLATAVKLIPIIVLSIAGIIWGKTSIIQTVPHGTLPAETSLFTGLGLAVLACLFAYDGFTNVAVVAGEIKSPEKIIPKATVIGVLTVIVAYLCVNISIYHVLTPLETLGLGKATSVSVAHRLLGDFGGRMINVGIMVSIFGGMNGYLLTLARNPYAMACRRQIPLSKTLSKVHPTLGTPINSIILIVLISWAELFMDADWLTNFSILSLWAFYILTYSGLFILRKRCPDAVRPFRVPLYPFVPIVALVGGVAVFIATFVGDPMMSIASCGATIIGLPVFWMARSYYKKQGE